MPFVKATIDNETRIGYISPENLKNPKTTMTGHTKEVVYDVEWYNPDIVNMIETPAKEYVVIRWCSCDEYHSHSEDKDCFHMRAMKRSNVPPDTPKGAFISEHNTREEAETAAVELNKGKSDGKT